MFWVSSGSVLGDSEIFRRFKRDSTRNIWDLFKTLELTGRQYNPNEKIINWKKVKVLNIESFYGFNKIPKMLEIPHLKKLHIWSCEVLQDEFFHGKKFPLLESLIFYKCERLEGDSVILHDSPVLKKIAISSCWRFSDTFFRNNNFNKVERVSLRYNKLLEGSNWNELKELRSLIVINCTSFTDQLLQQHSFPKLVFLKMKQSIELTGDKWKSNGVSNLKKLIICHCGSFGQNIFRTNTFSSLEYLKLKNLNLEDGKYWNSFNNLKYAYFHHSGITDELFRTQGSLSKLQLLHIVDDFITCTKWQPLPNLSVFLLKSLSAKDDIFEHSQTFPKLTKLSLEVCNQINGCGKGLQQLSNLRDFSVGYQSFTDENFKNINMEYLHLLTMSSCLKVKGRNWIQSPLSKLRFLRVLKIENCILFEDIFFQQQNLRMLEILELEKNDVLIGTKWNPFPSLQKMKISKCSKISDVLFSSENFSCKNLTELKLLKLKRLNGKNWNWLKHNKKLEILEIVKCDFFVDEIFKNEHNHFHSSLTSLLLKSNRTIHGIDWKELPKIKSLHIEMQHFCVDFFLKSNFDSLETLKLHNVYSTNVAWEMDKEKRNDKVNVIQKKLDGLFRILVKYERYMANVQKMDIQKCEFKEQIHRMINIDK